jgi:hypothetical protein
MTEEVKFQWGAAKLAEREAFDQISWARSQAEWLDAWQHWTSMVQQLRQQAKHPEPVSIPAFEFDSDAGHSSPNPNDNQ